MTTIPVKKLLVCVNDRLGYGQKSCAGSGSRELIKILRKLFVDNEVESELVEQACLGRCEEGINMRIAPGGPFFSQVTEQDLEQIVQALNDFVPMDKN